MLQARTGRSEVEFLLPSPGLSVTKSMLQRGGLSFFIFNFYFVHVVCGVCSHLYRCAPVQQLVCGILSSLKSYKYKLYANFLNPIQKALFLQLKCCIMALFSVGKQRLNAIPQTGRLQWSARKDYLVVLVALWTNTWNVFSQNIRCFGTN